MRRPPFTKLIRLSSWDRIQPHGMEWIHAGMEWGHTYSQEGEEGEEEVGFGVEDFGLEFGGRIPV